jgi:hypothetical protein
MRLLRNESLSWGRCPQTPGIYRLAAGMTERGGRSLYLRSFRPLSRRSGCVPAVPCPPLRSFQSGLLQPRRATIYQRTAITPLTSCLTPGVQFSSPWPAPFPPLSPPRFVPLCSTGSQVLWRSPTPLKRAGPLYGDLPFRTGLDPGWIERFQRSPGSRACCFSACAGS